MDKIKSHFGRTEIGTKFIFKKDMKKGLLLLFQDDSSYKLPNKRTTNTDNMGKLFVTLFAFAPALMTNL